MPPPPVQPYPPASDFTPPVSGEEPSEEIPFELEAEDVPTMKDLSAQIGAVGSHLQVVHAESSLARHAAESAAKSADAAHVAIGELRTLVVGDHAPRLTRVEQQASTIPAAFRDCAKKVGKYGVPAGAGAALYPLLEWLVPLASRWLESR